MSRVRFGIIGLGNIGRRHADDLLSGRVARGELTAVASTSPDKLAEFAAKGVRGFAAASDLIRSPDVDAVLIATPHVQHPALGQAGFAAGRHVLVEKPIAAHKADAERFVAAHQNAPGLVFGVMLQMRAEPRYQEIRARLHKGDLGEIVRVNWVNTDWFRSEAYYASSAWRATWPGEGGGVLLNQCLHNLDLLSWCLGQPARVRGFCQFGRFHDIEVEDNVTAYLEWPHGATGVFVSSTGEAPGVNRLEIVGTRGTLVSEPGHLHFTRNAVDMQEFSRTARTGFSKPDATTEAIPCPNAPAPHAAVTQNFVAAILDGTPLLAPGSEGIYSVELANAIVYSPLEGRTVELPLDGAAWEARLGELISRSRGARKPRPLETPDFAASFRS
jgi:predicted dehydrogenase